ncbi:winged helix-turn-helix transcriptional regulator [Nocardia donostiensis]|uniref:winged helix-turn-helix transcriptional regulator n=1 Tax=Nocardia donostiensis TaxID=1538463 RepID=UPI0009DB3CB0
MAHQTVRDPALEVRRRCPVPLPASGSPGCPIETGIELLRRRWTAHLLLALLHGPRSYQELSADIPGISDKVLAERLALLTASGIVDRDRRADFPPRVRYSLSGRATGLVRVLESLRSWDDTDHDGG